MVVDGESVFELRREIVKKMRMQMRLRLGSDAHL